MTHSTPSPPGPDSVDRAARLAALGHTPAGTETAQRQRTAELAGVVADDPDERTRAVALGALVRTGCSTAPGRPEPTTTTAWTGALADPAPRVRRGAAELAPVGPFPAPPLIALLDDPDALVAEAAASALGELGDDAVAAGAVSALSRVAAGPGHPDPLVREAAIAALGSLGHPDGLAAILAGCSDRPAVRRRAVLALAPFDGSEVDLALDRASADKDWQVRQVAADLRGATGDGSPPADPATGD